MHGFKYLLGKYISFSVMRIRAILFHLSLAVSLGACVSIPASEPKPQSDLSEDGVPFPIDLTESAGLDVIVNNRRLHLFLLPYSDSLVFINQSIAEDISLKPIFFGMGAVGMSDGDHRVNGRAFEVEYAVASSPIERAWALVMTEDLYPEYDGGISLGAIPANLLNLRLADRDDAEGGEIHTISLSGKSNALEKDRDYHALEFATGLALYQDPVTANRKAARYIRQSGRVATMGERQTLTRLFNNQRAFEEMSLDPPLAVGGREVSLLLGEADDTLDSTVPVERDTARSDDAQVQEVVTVMHDQKTAKYAPMLMLGRDFFRGCSDIFLDKRDFDQADQIQIDVVCTSTHALE